MIFDSTLKVVAESTSRLVVIVPPYYVFGLTFLFLGVIVPVALSILMKRSGFKVKGANLLKSPLALLLAIVGLNALGSESFIVFDGTRGQLTVERQYFFFFDSKRDYPLDSIDRIKIEDSKNARRLTLIQKSGQIVGLTNFSDRGGEEDALRAIHNFLEKLQVP